MIGSFILIIFSLFFIAYSIIIFIKRKSFAIKYKKRFLNFGENIFWEKVIIVTFPIQVLIGLFALYDGILGIYKYTVK